MIVFANVMYEKFCSFLCGIVQAELRLMFDLDQYDAFYSTLGLCQIHYSVCSDGVLWN